MYALERQDEILQIIKERKSASVNLIARELFVSPATVRRDLSAMEKAGLVRRTHGGAILTGSSSDETSIHVREQENVVEKKEIAALAVKFVKNNSSLYIDSSSTAGKIIPLLARFSFLSIVTNGLRNALSLSETTTARVYVTCGVVQSQSNSILGADTLEYCSKLHTDVAFISCNGLDAENGATEASLEQAKVKQTMLKNAAVKVLMADGSKFGKTFMARSVDFSDIDYLITDKLPPDPLKEKILSSGCKILTP
ncbi:MAG: DeoR/GlpR transcriptional regulator [Clostridia bacterium]|nr:DeoR/GlpR transcriptional regulator [Clostridia bacterium]